MDCPMAETPVTDNWHWMLSKSGKTNLPHAIMPPLMSNDGLLHRLARQSHALAG